MRDINEPLRIVYASALSALPCPVYYQYLPNNQAPPTYVVFRSINNVDASTKSSADTHTNITIELHTLSNIGNQGLNADVLADLVYQLVYQNKQTVLSLSRGQILQTELSNDVTNNFVLNNQFGYISRYITLRHWIFVEGTTGGNGPSINNGSRVLRYEYTGVGSETSFTNASLINRNVFDVINDGIGFSDLITSGTPVDKEVKYDALTGTISFAIPLESGQKVYVLYQI